MLRNIILGVFMTCSLPAFAATAAPRVKILTPSVLHEPAGESYVFNVEFSGVTQGDTWSLYQLPDGVDSAALNAIVTDLSPSNKTIMWQTSALPQGSYHFVAILKHDGHIYSSTARGSIDVEN